MGQTIAEYLSPSTSFLIDNGPHIPVTVGRHLTVRHPSFNVSFHIPLLSLSLRPPIRGLPLRKQEHFWQAIVGRDVLRNYELTIDWRNGLIRLVGS